MDVDMKNEECAVRASSALTSAMLCVERAAVVATATEQHRFTRVPGAKSTGGPGSTRPVPDGVKSKYDIRLGFGSWETLFTRR
jgi:hypothetical protein